MCCSDHCFRIRKNFRRIRLFFLNIQVSIPIQVALEKRMFTYEGRRQTLTHSNSSPEFKCSKTVNAIKVVTDCKSGPDKATLPQLYCPLIRSKLDYGCM